MRWALMRVTVLAFVLAVLVVLSPRAALAFTPPPITGHVTDPSGVLAAEDRARLDRKLADYRACASHEVAVFLAPSLGGETIEDVAYTTFNTWKIGRRDHDDGVLLVIAPNERKVRIETGKGVGGDLTDLGSFHILRDHVKPHLARGAFFDAVDDGTTAIGGALGGCAMPSIGASTPPPSASVRPAPRRAPTPVDVPPAPSVDPKPSSSPIFAVVLVLATMLGFFVLVFYAAYRDKTAIVGIPFAVIGATFATMGAGAVFGTPNAVALTAFLSFFGIHLPLWRYARHRRGGPWRPERSYGGSSGSAWTSSSSGASASSSSSSSSSGSDSSGGGYSGSDYSGGGGSSGGGGASDSY